MVTYYAFVVTTEVLIRNGQVFSSSLQTKRKRQSNELAPYRPTAIQNDTR